MTLELVPQRLEPHLPLVRPDRRQVVGSTVDVSAVFDRIHGVSHPALRSQLERLVALVDETGAIGGDRHRELCGVRRLFGQVRASLEAAVAREQDVLAPMVELLLTDDHSRVPVEPVLAQIAWLSARHAAIRALLDDLRRVTDGYYIPSDGCRYESCYRALADLDRDARRYLDDARDALFPAVQAAARGHVISGDADDG